MGSARRSALIVFSLFLFSDSRATTPLAPGESTSVKLTASPGGCDLVNGENIQAGTTVNVMLRAMTAIAQSMNGFSTTASIGSRYEVQLLIDGVQHGWFVRRLRSTNQNDYFEATAENVLPGNHRYTLAARLLDPGQIVFAQKWITATGSPSSNPSEKSILPSAFPLTPSWQIVSDTLNFTSGGVLDLFLNGYMQITTGTPGEQLAIAFQLDSNPSIHVSYLSIPPQLYAGVNFVDYFSNVPAGTHTLRWWARTTSGNASVEWRDIEFVSFPAYQGSLSLVFGEATSSTPTTVSTDHGACPGPTCGAPQPSPPILQGCGSWTPLLTLAPGTVVGFNTVALTGYVQVTGGIVNPGPAQFAITQDQAGYEIGIISLGILSLPDGYYFFSDGSNDIGCAGCTITLWARKIAGCIEGAGPGSFSVGLRYLAAKWTPMDGCRY